MPRSEEVKQRWRRSKRREHIWEITRQMFLKQVAHPLPPGIKTTNDIVELESAVERNLKAAIAWYEEHFFQFSMELKEILLDPNLRPAA